MYENLNNFIFQIYSDKLNAPLFSLFLKRAANQKSWGVTRVMN